MAMSEGSDPEEPPTQQNNPIRCTIRVDPSGDEWKAHEPSSETELYGIGSTPPEAVANYALALEHRENESDTSEYRFPSLDELPEVEA